MIMFKTLATLFILGSVTALAQDTDSTSTNDLQEEIKIFKNYIPEISRVNKKNQQPLFLDSVYIKENLKYQVKKMILKVDENNHPLSAVDYKKPFENTFNSYLLLGYSTDKRPLAELSLSNRISDKSKYGLFLRHYSENREDDKLFYSDRNEQKAMAYFDFMDNGMTFKSNLRYERIQVNSDQKEYDYNPLIGGTSITLENEERLHQIISGDFAFEQNDEQKLVQGLNFNIKHGFNNNDASETYIDFGSRWNVSLGEHKIITNLDFITADHETKVSNRDARLSHFQFDPTFYGVEGNLSFQIGINSYFLIHEMNHSTFDLFTGVKRSDEDFLIFPKIHLSYAMPEETNVFIGYKGEYGINSYVDALKFSPFITHSIVNLPIPNSTIAPVNIYAGINTKTIHNLDLNLMVSYKEYDRFQNFQASFGDINNDFPLYLYPRTFDLNQLSIEVNGKYRFDKQTLLSSNLQYNNYGDHPSYIKLAHLPEFQFSLAAEHSINEKLKAFGEVDFSSSQYTMDVINEKMDAYSNLNLGVSYDLNDRLNTGLQIRNILDNQVETKEGYITNGFNVFLSARYKF